MNFKELFKNKGLGYWLCTGASVISLIFAIVVFATWKTALPAAVGDGYIIGVILLLPIIIQAVVTFFPVRFADKVCQGFGITLSQFFAEGDDPVSLTRDQRKLLDNWSALTKAQQRIFTELFESI